MKVLPRPGMKNCLHFLPDLNVQIAGKCVKIEIILWKKRDTKLIEIGQGTLFVFHFFVLCLANSVA